MLPTLVPFVEPKRPPPHLAQYPKSPDIFYGSNTPGGYAHQTRTPNTNYQKLLLEYNQRAEGERKLEAIAFEKAKTLSKLYISSVELAAKKRGNQKLQTKFEEKMKEYEESVERRRQKLKILLHREEHEYMKETLFLAQKGKENIEKESLMRIEHIRSKKKAEEEEIVHAKRLQQYLERCEYLRPIALKAQCHQTKLINLQQMRENEAKKEKEKEIDNMWHQVMMQEIQQKVQRKEQEVLEIRRKQKEAAEVHKRQIQGLNKLREEMKCVAEEDAREMDALVARVAQEEREAAEMKARKHREYSEEVQRQKEIQDALRNQRQHKEKISDMLYAKLNQEELDREQRRLKDSTQLFTRDMELYRDYLAKLKEKRIEEEAKTEEHLKIFQNEVEAKEAQMRCRDLQARQRLHEEVMLGRKMQLDVKQKEAEFEKQMKEAEIEGAQFVRQQNKKLEQLQKQQQLQETEKYRQDLKNQQKYANLKKEQERLEEQRMLENGCKNEENYMNQVEELFQMGAFTGGLVHPFRRALNQKDCHCLPKISSIHFGK